MSDIKMSDVFPSGYNLTFDYCPSYTGTEETFGFIFLSSEPCVFICDAVNNHDRLVEENAQLKADKAELIKFVESLQLDVSNEIALELLLSKINGESK
jgi:hypothetical protein